ncbi:DUF4193 family protein [Kocuria sabuli]|uniref:DUF4193 family protein n=1 Tax=Kocuria sabuli TaxID=3071448 RepID=UPI0034D732A3
MASRHLAFSSASRAPEHIDEFACCSCSLAQHRSQLTRRAGALGCCAGCES